MQVTEVLYCAGFNLPQSEKIASSEFLKIGIPCA